jgi:hypothetical protein
LITWQIWCCRQHSAFSNYAVSQLQVLKSSCLCTSSSEGRYPWVLEPGNHSMPNECTLTVTRRYARQSFNVVQRIESHKKSRSKVTRMSYQLAVISTWL